MIISWFISGDIVMSVEAETTFDDVVANIIPLRWVKMSYPTEKSLDEYLPDLAKRVDFFRQWVTTGRTPDNFWISGFFFPQSFLTGVKQNFARKSGTSVENVAFKFDFLDHGEATVDPYQSLDPPGDGGGTSVVIYGLYIEGRPGCTLVELPL